VFAAVATLESALVVKGLMQRPPSLSEQQFVDCMPGVCGGGLVEKALAWSVNHRLFTEQQQPYLRKNNPYGSNSGKCSAGSSGSIPSPNDYCYSSHLKSDQELQSLIKTLGPTSVLIYTDPQMQMLRGKWNSRCPVETYNHAVVAVGWDPNYWILRNSWGKEWGVGGYMYLRRGSNNCDIYAKVAVPIY